MVVTLLGGQWKQGTIMTSRFYDYRLEGRLLIFHGSNDDHFWPWELRVKAVLWGEDIIEAIFNKDVDRRTSEKELAVILSSLGDEPFGAIDVCKTVIEALEKLFSRYVGKSMINKLILLKHLLNGKVKFGDQMGDHVAQLECQFSRLAAVGSTVEEQMKVQILLSSLSETTYCAPTPILYKNWMTTQQLGPKWPIYSLKKANTSNITILDRIKTNRGN